MQKKQTKITASLDDEDDFQLFRDAVQDITPLEQDEDDVQLFHEVAQDITPLTQDEDDFQLFRDTVQDITPLEQDTIHHQTKKPINQATQVDSQTQKPLIDFLSDEAEVERINPLDTLSYRVAGIQKRVFKKLRRGQYIIIDEIDLHGLNSQQAKKLLLHFLASALQVEGSCIRIIHGKGHHSGDKEPVIKRQTNHWLKQHPRVLAFHSAQPKEGGTGALYVLLRRSQLSGA